MRCFAANGAVKVLELAMKFRDAQKHSFGEAVPGNVLLFKKQAAQGYLACPKLCWLFWAHFFF